MTIMDSKDFPGWDAYYRENDPETMPWFSADLDLDVREAIRSRGLTGGDFLDLGTGPGTQAVELAKLGFNVTGSDVSGAAVAGASKLGGANFVEDDILDTGIAEDSFDFVLDRGCFHVFAPDMHAAYLDAVKRILRRGGILFLKCMSTEETNLPEDSGPYKYAAGEIEGIFAGHFEIEDSRNTVYYCRVEPAPKALFFVMRKK